MTVKFTNDYFFLNEDGKTINKIDIKYRKTGKRGNDERKHKSHNKTLLGKTKGRVKEYTCKNNVTSNHSLN